MAKRRKSWYKHRLDALTQGQKISMFEDRFLEQALEELENLRKENKELKRKILIYEKFMKDVEELLNRSKKMNEEIRI